MMMPRGLLKALLLVASPIFHLVTADPVVIFGDSWACGEIPVMPRVLQAKGSSLTSTGQCMVSTTAANWAEYGKDAIEDGLDDNPDAKVVVVQLGGNDIVYGLASKMPLDTIKATLKANLETVVKTIHDKRPGLPVVINTYTYFPFDEGTQCGKFASDLMEGGEAIKMKEFNQFHRSIAAVFENLDVMDVTVVETYHVLQQKAGVCDDDMGTPMSMFGDCIHPTEEGFMTLMGYVYDRAIAKYEPVNLRGAGGAIADIAVPAAKEVAVLPSACANM